MAKYNENAKIELFSRTAGGATGIKTATSAWEEVGERGRRGEERLPLDMKREDVKMAYRRNSNPTVALLSPASSIVYGL